jgi:hypothetical protein
MHSTVANRPVRSTLSRSDSLVSMTSGGSPWAAYALTAYSNEAMTVAGPKVGERRVAGDPQPAIGWQRALGVSRVPARVAWVREGIAQPWALAAEEPGDPQYRRLSGPTKEGLCI